MDGRTDNIHNEYQNELTKEGMTLNVLRVEQNKSLRQQTSLEQKTASREDELKKIAVESQEDLVTLRAVCSLS